MARPRNKILPIATVLVWLVAYGAWTADWVIQPMPHLLERSLLRIPMCIMGVACCLAIGSGLTRMARRGIAIRVGAGVALCAVAALAYSALGTFVFSSILPLWGSITLDEMLANSLADAWVFMAWLALYFAIVADADARDARVALAEARTAEQRARNQALAQQINPHFLFNTLNAVSGLILEGDDVRAERVTMGLASLLRRSLERDATETVSLAEEVEALRRYLEIEEVRFEGRFRFVDDVPATERLQHVPSLILQPLVENAIKHGVARTPRPVTLVISAVLRDGTLRIDVSDDAAPDRPADPPTPVGVGIGQSNTRRRLELLYGSAASLVCGAVAAGGYRCTLIVPASATARA